MYRVTCHSNITYYTVDYLVHGFSTGGIFDLPWRYILFAKNSHFYLLQYAFVEAKI